jgi:hypothetical protein
MNTIHFTILSFFIAGFGLSGCATTPMTVDGKYIFPEFEEVDRITTSRISGWQSIDSRSLIVEDSPSTYYLIVLRDQVRDLNFSEVISLSSTGTQTMSKFDCVSVERSSCFVTTGAPIERIYKLNSREAVNYVRNFIRNR